MSRGVLLLHGNLPIHTSKVVKAALNETVFEETELPPYSPNLVPSNYNLLRNLKLELRGKKFEGENDMKCSFEAQFAVSDKNIFFTVLRS